MVYRRSRTNIRKPMRRRATRSGRPSTRRRTVRRTSTRSKACVCPGPPSPGAKFAFAQIDPFHTLATGAKIPDSNTIPSVSNTDVDIVTVQNASNAAWFAAVAFRPQYRGGVVTGSPTVGGVTWGVQYSDNTSNRSKYNLYSAQIELTRPVAHAIRMTSPVAPTTATGFVHIGLAVESRVNSIAGALPDLPLTVNAMTGLAHYARFTLASLTQSPVTVINKWIDETGFRYDDPRSGPNYASGGTTPFTAVQPIQSTFNFGQSWATIVVMVEGQSTGSSPISFEHLLLTECIPRKDAFILGTQAAPNSPGTMSAVSQMSASGDFAHTEAGQESYINKSLAALAEGAKTAGAQVYDNVAVPLLQRAGNMAVNYATNVAIASLAGYAGISGVNSNPGRLALTR